MERSALEVEELVRPLRGLRVLLLSFSGRGFPGGDGAAQAARLLSELGVPSVFVEGLRDPSTVPEVRRFPADVVLLCTTAPIRFPGLRKIAGQKLLWCWDPTPPRPGSLRSVFSHVFLSWASGLRAEEYGRHADCAPSSWRTAFGASLHYMPHGSYLPTSAAYKGDRDEVLFIGDVHNPVFHRGRAELCRRLGARVVNETQRDARLRVEALSKRMYPAAAFSLSASPQLPGYTSVRTYNILACGGLLLLRRFPGSDALFGEHLGFESREEAAELVERYRRDRAERRRLAEAGRQRYTRRHTILHRVVDILRIAKGHAERFRGAEP